jgi:hypothetical protein
MRARARRSARVIAVMGGLASEFPPFTAEQVEALKQEQRFADVTLERTAELDDTTIVQMCAALLRGNRVKLSYVRTTSSPSWRLPPISSTPT